MSSEVTDVIEAFAAHGFRLRDQTKVEVAVRSAAKAATIGASKTSMAFSESSPEMFHICSTVGK